jgi:NTE family protein
MIASVLADLPLLDGLDPDTLGRLTEQFVRRSYPAGSEVVRQGQPCESFFVIESGSLFVHSDRQGTLARLGPGDCVGEISMLTGQPASATVSAVSDTLLLVAPQAEVHALVDEAPLLARNFCRLLGHRLAVAGQRAHHGGRALLVGAGGAPLHRAVPEGSDGPGEVGFAVCLAVSLAYHLGQKVALLDLGTRIQASSPRFQDLLPQLTVVRARCLSPDQLPPLLDRLSHEYGYVLAWTPDPAAEQWQPLIASIDRLLLAVPHQVCGSTDFSSWRSQASATGTGSAGGSLTEPELVILGAPEPHSPAAYEEMARGTGLSIAALLPAPPSVLDQAAGVSDWVIRQPEAPFARGVARLARRLAGKTVGLALGAGAGRGHAHVGVLQALERSGIDADFVAGTSIGAFVAGMVALRVPSHEMELSIRRVGESIRRWSVPVHSFLAGSRLDEAIRSAVPEHLRIEDLPLPCAGVAADLLTGEPVVLRRGSAWLCARACASIPGAFPPVLMDGKLLLDGGVAVPVPCQSVREMGADVVIGVSLETLPRATSRRQRSSSPSEPPEPGPATSTDPANNQRLPTWPTTLLRSLDILQQSLTRYSVQEADVPVRVFTPPINLTDFRGGPEFLEAGEKAVAAAQERLRALLPWAR